MFICPYCNKEFKSKKGLGYHLNKIHIDKRIITKEKCKNPNCNNFIEIISYENVELIHSKNCCCRECYNEYIKFSRKKDITCEICGEKFDSITKFKNHKCFEINSFECKYCNNKYSSKIKLKNHIMKNHKEQVIKIKVKCANPNCSKEIETLQIGDDINHHRKTCSDQCLKEYISHLGKKEKIFKCSACNEKFSSIELLNKHFKNRHQREDCKFECLICGAKFKNIDQLHSHYYQYHKDLIIKEKIKCKNPNCNNYTYLLKINDYVIKENNKFCSKSCSAKSGNYDGNRKYWKSEKSVERRYKLTLQNNGTCKWYNYIDKNNNKHRVQGSYELAFANKLDELDIEFFTHPKGIKYDFNDKMTYYFPDFYIPSKNLYVDTKSRYYMDLSKDKFKIFRQQHPKLNLAVLTENLLICYGIDKQFIKKCLDNYNE